MKKNFIKTAVLCLIAGLTLNGCSKNENGGDSGNGNGNVSVTSVSLNETAKTLTVGASFTLTATVAPDKATNKTLTWSSSNTAIATVSNGTVSAIAAGETVITVKTADGNKTATCTVTVAETVVPVTGVSLGRSDTTLIVGASFTLTATVAPDNATNKTLTWTSSNTAIATVSNGTVNAIAPGEAVITVKTADGAKTATCAVTVAVVPVTGISLSRSDTVLTTGDTFVLTATVTPDNATNKTLVWTSSYPAIASVSNGTVTALANGKTDITVSTEDGTVKASCFVKVNAPNLEKALYCLKYAIDVSTKYNEQSLKPSGISGVANIYYQSGMIDYMYLWNMGDMIVPFHTDLGRRPSTICEGYSRNDAVTYNTLKNGNYDFDANPANLLACFLDFGANSANLNNFSIPTGAPAAALSAMITQKNSYKMLVYGKNKEGKLICKYIGYVEGSQYHYWDTDPDSPAHGKSGSKSF